MIVTCSPHIRHRDTTQTIMRDVIIALLPALAVAVYVFGMRALVLTAVCVIAAVISEWGFAKICKKPSTISDYSAIVTGLILAYNLPVGLPLWMAAFGSLTAIVVIKQLFGGLGQNFANPAITARVIMLVSFAGPMTDWITGYPDAVAGATPLAIMAGGQTDAMPSVAQMALGTIGGSLGEVSSVALLIGFAYLLYRKVITWHITVSFIATVAVLAVAFGQNPLYHLFAGGLMLGAIFMATDYTTSPQTPKGRIIFGIGCGVITILIRVFGSYPEGVSFAILLMNIVAPLISNHTMNKPLGGATK